MNELMPFSYEGNQVRTVIIVGEPWFVAKDVCDILGLEQVSRAMDRLDEDERGLLKVTHPQSPGKLIEVNAINEPGLYQLIISSNKPEAKDFKRWITHEVIPQIRKTGTYSLESRKLISLALVEANKIIEEQDQKIALMSPKADFYDTVAGSKDAIPIGEAAKVLNMGIGQNNLFKLLRDCGILRQNNQPYQEYIDRGYFRVIEQKYDVRGETHVYIKTLVYQRGLDYIRKLINKQRGKAV